MGQDEKTMLTIYLNTDISCHQVHFTKNYSVFKFFFFVFWINSESLQLRIVIPWWIDVLIIRSLVTLTSTCARPCQHKIRFHFSAPDANETNVLANGKGLNMRFLMESSFTLHHRENRKKRVDISALGWSLHFEAFQARAKHLRKVIMYRHNSHLGLSDALTGNTRAAQVPRIVRWNMTSTF